MISRWFRRLAGVCLTAVFVLSPAGRLSSRAAGTEVPDAPYDYQITFYAGNQGVFRTEAAVTVLEPDGVTEKKDAQIRTGADRIVVKGLNAGDLVVFDPVQNDAVLLEEGSPYYVRGLRRSGADNDDEKLSAFPVKQDQDYVVAYGVRGEQVPYVIRYVDRSGQELLKERTYYGNVKDQLVVAFQYIAGYEPQAYNLKKTLSKNEAENVFTFIYSRVTASGGSGGGSGTSGGGASGGGTAGAGTGAGTGAAAGGQMNAAGAGGGAAGAGGEAAGMDGTETELPDTEAPAGEWPRDVINLDDEDTPLAGMPNFSEAARAGFVYTLPVLAAVSLSLSVALVLYAWHRYLLIRLRRYKKEKDERP